MKLSSSTAEAYLKGPPAGPMFENVCIQETVKRFLHNGQRPPLFDLRTASGLERVLLVDQPMGNPIPVEIKLNKTPPASLAQSLVKFSEAFPKPAAEESMVARKIKIGKLFPEFRGETGRSPRFQCQITYSTS